MVSLALLPSPPVAANDPTPERDGSAATVPRLVAGHARRALVLSPASAGPDRYAVRIDGEPVRPREVAVLGPDALDGLDLLRDGDFADAAIPWRAMPGDAVRTGRDIAEQWTLRSGHTAFASLRPGLAEALVVYEGEDGSDRIPVRPRQVYAFHGLFGLHRCRAFLRAEILRDALAIVGRTEVEIPRRPGGREPGDYAIGRLEIATPRDAAFARLTLAVRPLDTAGPDGAHLFFTGLRFGQPSPGRPSPWTGTNLDPAACLAVARGDARLLDISLPGGLAAAPGSVSVVDAATGLPIAGSPRAPSPRPLAFTAYPFDGVTLHGRLGPDLSGPVPVDLLINGAWAATVAAEPGPDGAADLSVAIPPAWLDGAPHRIELVAAETGRLLHADAALLRATLEPWDLPDAAGAPCFPPEDHPLARLRYRSLLAHLDREPDGARHVRRAHAVLCGRPDSDDGAPWTLPVSDAPDVTVLLHGTADPGRIRHSLAGLTLARTATSIEVLAASDLGLVAGVPTLPDGPEPLLERLGRAARGDVVLLLEIGCEPLGGWLDGLRAALSEDPAVAVATPKLLASSGRLAAAGGVLTASGRAEPVTLGGNAADPRAGFARRCDWAPLSALLLRRADLTARSGLLAQTGGGGPGLPDQPSGLPDPLDLACALRRLGRGIAYVPSACVALPAGQRAVLPASATIAQRRLWADILAGGPGDDLPVPLAAGHRARGRVLFIDLKVPRPDTDAGSYAADQEMRLFAALGFAVTFLPLDLARPGRYAAALEARGVEILHAPFAGSVEDALARRAGEFDLVYITRYNVARVVLPFLRQHQPRAKRLFNVADLHFLRELRAGLAAGDPDVVARSRVTRDAELALMREVDLTLTYSDVEAAVIQGQHLDRVAVRRLPWVVEPAAHRPGFAGRAGLVFLGSFGHRPNVDAVAAFVRDVMPRLRERLPGVTLTIAGSQTTDEVSRLAAADVMVPGHVADLAAFHGAARLFVAPLLSGAGIKGKVLGAMAQGCPCVLSPIAAEALGGRDGVDHRLAESPAEWADAIVALHEDEAAWTAMADGGLDLVRRRYGLARGVAAMRQVLEAVGWFLPDEAR